MPLGSCTTRNHVDTYFHLQTQADMNDCLELLLLVNYNGTLRCTKDINGNVVRELTISSDNIIPGQTVVAITAYLGDWLVWDEESQILIRYDQDGFDQRYTVDA